MKGSDILAGFIDYENLNEELQEMIDRVANQAYTKIEPVEFETTWESNDYPNGTSLFVLNYSPDNPQTTDDLALTWLEVMYGSSEDLENSVFTVTTIKYDDERPNVVQKVELLEDGRIKNVYYRTIYSENDIYEWDAFVPLSTGGSNPPTQRAVLTVNDRLPDDVGNVNTAFQVIDVVEPWVKWDDSAYPFGVSEFITVWNKVEQAEYIAENPSFDKLPEGRIMVRTHKMNTTASRPEIWQEVDTSEDGIFHATFARLGKPEGEWGELNADNGSHVIHIDPLPPTATFDDYPVGVSIFAVIYDEGDLSWYEALNFMPVDEYEAYTGHKPYGKVAVTSFRNKTLLTQFIQVQDAVGELEVVGRYFTKIENRWFGSNNRNNGIDGKVKKVNGIRPDHLGNVNITSTGTIEWQPF